MDKHLHIITHDVPYPADFGGVIDLFYKIKHLHQSGIKIHLHCFTKKRAQQSELNKYCVSVNYYPRQNQISFRLPFIVSSRKSQELITNLLKDDHPILIEGIHCSYELYNNNLAGRKILLRLHNAEFEYYHQLAKHEKNVFKKIYFLYESFLLEKYERTIAAKASILAVSTQDVALYQKKFNATNIEYLPVFLPYSDASGHQGKGTFCLYHGNLSINENEEAVVWLLENVFNDIEIPFVLAGKNPSKKLVSLSHQQQHTCLVENPGDKDLQDMIAKAQINILPSFNNTGVKLKLLNALYNGRHCIVNMAGAEGSGVESLCAISDHADLMKQSVIKLYDRDYTSANNEERNMLLHQLYNNDKNAQRIIEILWG